MVGTTADLIWGIRNCSAKGSIERRVEIFSYERERERERERSESKQNMESLGFIHFTPLLHHTMYVTQGHKSVANQGKMTSKRPRYASQDTEKPCWSCFPSPRLYGDVRQQPGLYQMTLGYKRWRYIVGAVQGPPEPQLHHGLSPSE